MRTCCVLTHNTMRRLPSPCFTCPLSYWGESELKGKFIPWSNYLHFTIVSNNNETTFIILDYTLLLRISTAQRAKILRKKFLKLTFLLIKKWAWNTQALGYNGEHVDGIWKLKQNLYDVKTFWQGRTEWRNCRLSTKTPEYQLGQAFMALCKRRDILKRNLCFVDHGMLDTTSYVTLY